MSKYDALGSYLKRNGMALIPMTFGQIEEVVGEKLPPSAYRHRPWWSNNTSNSVMTKVWLEAGYQTEQVDMAARKLVFKRKNGNPASLASVGGMADSPREFKAKEKVSVHPAFGALKGTFTIEPGHDLTRPAFDPDEIEAWETKLDRMADEGSRRKK